MFCNHINEDFLHYFRRAITLCSLSTVKRNQDYSQLSISSALYNYRRFVSNKPIAPKAIPLTVFQENYCIFEEHRLLVLSRRQVTALKICVVFGKHLKTEVLNDIIFQFIFWGNLNIVCI